MKHLLVAILQIILPVQEGWGESFIASGDGFGADIPVSASPAAMDLYVALFLISSLMFFLFFFRRTVIGVEGSFLMTTGNHRTKELIEDQYFSDSALLSLLLLLPIYSYVFVRTGITDHSYWYTILLLLSLVILRYSSLFVIAWLVRKRQVLEVNKCFNGIGVLIMSLSAVILPFKLFIPSITPEFASVYVASVAFAGFILYLIRICRIIVASGFSHFFLILYLCGLEILPLCVVIKAIVS